MAGGFAWHAAPATARRNRAHQDARIDIDTSESDRDYLTRL